MPYVDLGSPSIACRVLSRAVANYPFSRGKTRLRAASGRWLVGQLSFGPWVRVSGVVDAEWEYLTGQVKEQRTTDFLHSYIKPGMTFVDVGSNVGYFTLLAASLGARVVAYEPTPAVYKRLRENVALNSLRNVTLVNAAVANKSGKLTLYQSPDDPEANNTFGEGDCCLEVAAVTLDEDLAAHGIQTVQVLKIDAEGAEPLVLRGAAKLMNSKMPPLILIEVNSHCLHAAGSSPEAVLEVLQRSEYRCVEMERGLYKGQPVANVVAIPPQLNITLPSTALEMDGQEMMMN